MTGGDPAGAMRTAVEEVARGLGLDRRYCYWRVAVEGRGQDLTVEISRAVVARELAGRLGGCEPAGGDGAVSRCAGPRGGVVTIVDLERRGFPLRVVSSVADIRREPAHAAELVNQAIMGELATAVKREGDWYLVRLDDDYHGWVRSWYLAESDTSTAISYDRRVDRMVTANIAYVLERPDAASLPVSDVVAGTGLVALEREGGYLRIELPNGRTGFLPSDALSEPPRGKPDRDRIVSRALRFLGIQYLWGGTSAKGFDCSGLVKRVYQMEGVMLPRDADRQAEAGRPLPGPPSGAGKGDLLFFGEGGLVSHVAVNMDGRRFIHASGEVRIGSLDAGDELYDERLAGSLLFGRNVID